MKYREQLKKAIEYAIATGSFSKRNMARRAKNVCVFGVGRYFEEVYKQWKIKENFNVNYVCDNDPKKWGREFAGTICISPKELGELDDVVVIPMVGNGIVEVEQQLQDMNIKYLDLNDIFFELIMKPPTEEKWFKSNKLLKVYDNLVDEESKKVYVNVICNRIAPHLSQYRYGDLYSEGEYFEHGIFKLNDNECFVDCGAYIGDSMLNFLKSVCYKFNNIFCFEMDSNNYFELIKNKNHLEEEIKCKIECINAGVWNENSSLFYGKEDLGSRESYSFYKEENLVEVRTVKIDDILRNKQVTFIKMDIEGAELNALKGAREIIQENKPKLAICLYHKLQDFWEIPCYLKEIVPEYKFCVRHHQKSTLGGTVLYAYI